MREVKAIQRESSTRADSRLFLSRMQFSSKACSLHLFPLASPCLLLVASPPPAIFLRPHCRGGHPTSPSRRRGGKLTGSSWAAPLAHRRVAWECAEKGLLLRNPAGRPIRRHSAPRMPTARQKSPSREAIPALNSNLNRKYQTTHKTQKKTHKAGRSTHLPAATDDGLRLPGGLLSPWLQPANPRAASIRMNGEFFCNASKSQARLPATPVHAPFCVVRRRSRPGQRCAARRRRNHTFAAA